MSSIIDVLMDRLKGDNLGKISNQVGAREKDTAKAMPEILDLLTEAWQEILLGKKELRLSRTL